MKKDVEIEKVIEALARDYEYLSYALTKDPTEFAFALEEIYFALSTGVEQEGFLLAVAHPQLLLAAREALPTLVQREVKVKDGVGEIRLYLMPTKNKKNELVTELTKAYVKEISKEEWERKRQVIVEAPVTLSAEKASKYVPVIVVRARIKTPEKREISVEESLIDGRELEGRDLWRSYVRIRGGKLRKYEIEGVKVNGTWIAVATSIGSEETAKRWLEKLDKSFEYEVGELVIEYWKNGRKVAEINAKEFVEDWIKKSVRKIFYEFEVGKERYVIFGREVISYKKFEEKMKKRRLPVPELVKISTEQVIEAIAYGEIDAPEKLRKYASLWMNKKLDQDYTFT